MGLLDLFKKKEKEETGGKEKILDTAGLEIYSGIRAEVTDLDGRLLFVAKLVGIHGYTAQLNQYSEAAVCQDGEFIRVKIRGYSDHERKAVYMEGTITPGPNRTWQVENLSVTRIANERAFFRLETNIEATATVLSGPGAGEKPCR